MSSTTTDLVIAHDPDEQLDFAVGHGMAWYLTPCCKASGKGSAESSTHVCCRGCYADVDPIFGTGPSAATVLAITGLEVTSL